MVRADKSYIEKPKYSRQLFLNADLQKLSKNHLFILSSNTIRPLIAIHLYYASSQGFSS